MLAFVLTSCWTSISEDNISEEDAKKILLEQQKNSDSFKDEIKNTPNFDNSDESNETQNWENDSEENSKNILSEIIFPVWQAVVLDELPKITNNTTYVWIQGYVDSWVDKIEVKFSNLTSDFPNDSFVLREFKKWDNRFLYNANKVYKVLDFGLNEYEIITYKWEEKFITRVEIVVPREPDIKTQLFDENTSGDTKNQDYIIIEEDSSLEEVKNIDSQSVFEYKKIDFQDASLEESTSLSFPENSYIWEVLNLWKNEFTYSKINNLSFNKIYKTKNINCEELTSYILNQYDFAYWNTCRAIWDFNSPKWYSFYTLYLKDGKFYYEKHYYNSESLVFWIVEIVSWTGVDKNNISDKNADFKTKYNSIDNLKKADILFENIKK